MALLRRPSKTTAAGLSLLPCGALISFCLTQGLSPRKVRNDPTHLADYQRLLTNDLGVRLSWPEEIRTHRD